MRKKFFSLLFLQIFSSFFISAKENNKLIEKTKKTVEKVTKKIAEPITDPKAAFSYWFDFDPRIERGEKTNFNILPLVVVSPERGFGLGLQFAQESLLRKKDIVRIRTIQTLKNKSSYRFIYQLPPSFIKHRLFDRAGGEIEVGYENYGRFYYGIGNHTLQENESEYIPELFDLKIPLLYGLSQKISAGLSLNFQNWKVVEVSQSGDLKKELPSLIGKDGSRLYTSTFLLRWDSRNSKTNPSKGTFAEGKVEYSKKLLGSEADFTRTTMEMRGFHPILQKNDHIFGVRLFLDYKSGDVPFYLLPELGGIFFNRGLIEGRFRDTLSVSGNWEYRLKIFQRLDWAFFVDAGNVYSEFKTIQIKRIKITGGTGMRYYVPPGNLLLARIDGGYSSEGLQIYLTFDHPF